MDTVDDIAHCTLMLDQARSLRERGRLREALGRVRAARERARRALCDPHEAGFTRQLKDVMAACRALFRELGPAASSSAA